MAISSQRLSRQDWILAGYRALVSGGAPALRVEPVAKAIGATKGSFYWHFSGPGDWHDAMLSYWMQAALTDVIDGLQGLPAGRPRLDALFEIASAMGRGAEHGGTFAEPALRAWAGSEAKVATAVAHVDAARLAFLAQNLAACDLTKDAAEQGARLLYACHIGQQAMGQGSVNDTKDLTALLVRLVGP